MEFSPAAYQVSESVGAVNALVKISKAPDQPVSVGFESVAGSAASPADFGFVSGTLNFAPGDPLEKSIVVNIVNDDLKEPDEAFELTLMNPQNAVLGVSTASVVILDDDTFEVSIAPSSATVLVGEAVDFVVTPSGGVAPYALNWTFGDGTSVSSTELAASHAYTSAGAYNVVASVADGLGNIASDNSTVVVEEPTDPNVIPPKELFADRSEIIWSTEPDGTSTFELIGRMQLPPEHNPTTLTGVVSVTVTIGNHTGFDTISKLTRVGNSSIFTEPYTSDVTGLEVRHGQLDWQPAGRAIFTLAGEFNYPGINMNTQPPIVIYSFAAPVKNESVEQIMGDSVTLEHNVLSNTWLFEP